MSYKYKQLTKENRNYDDNIELVMKDIALDEIKGMDEEEAKNFLTNDAIPLYGSVNNLIYYSDTEQIAKEYYDEIIELLKNIYVDCIPIDLLNFNKLTWFAWEYIILNNEDNINEIIKLAKEKKLLGE